MDDPATLAEQLRPVALKLSRQLRREALSVGLGPQDAQLMVLIFKRPGIGVSELADLEQVSRPSMSAQVKRLEQQGLVTRSGTADDRRRAPLTLTPEGRHALSQVKRSRTDWLEGRLARLTPKERAALAQAIAPLLKLAEMKS